MSETPAPATPSAPLPVTPLPPAAVVPASTQAGQERAVAPQTMDEIAVSTINNRVALNIFGDAAFYINSAAPERPAFALGTLDLLVTGRSGPLLAMSEIALETDPATGDTGLDLERMFVGWHTDRFSIDAGRTHTELGYWNNAFHHGSWLQMPVNRPRVVLFEDQGGILPIHSVGATGRWRVLTGEHQIELIAALANGRGNIVDNVRLGDDTNLWKSVLFKVEFKGFGARDLRVGLSGLYDRIAPADATIRPALPDVTIPEWIGNAYLAYRSPELTVIAEGYDILHTAEGQTWNTFDGFGLLAYRLGDFSPYATGEIRAGQIQSDPFFFPTGFPDPANPQLLGRYAEVAAGVRWDVSTWSAIKLEYRETHTESPRSNDQRGIVDWSFGL